MSQVGRGETWEPTTSRISVTQGSPHCTNLQDRHLTHWTHLDTGTATQWRLCHAGVTSKARFLNNSIHWISNYFRFRKVWYTPRTPLMWWYHSLGVFASQKIYTIKICRVDPSKSVTLHTNTLIHRISFHHPRLCSQYRILHIQPAQVRHPHESECFLDENPILWTQDQRRANCRFFN